jgi:hypothetical protein
MAELADIQKLVEELGPANPDIASVVQYDEAEWAVAFDEQNIVSLEWDEPSARLVFTADLGRPIEDRRLEVAEAALDINTLWRDHGGVWIGRSGAEGEMLLMYALSAVDLTLEQLQTVVDNFAVKARVWRDYVGSDGISAASSETLDPAAAMRV